RSSEVGGFAAKLEHVAPASDPHHTAHLGHALHLPVACLAVESHGASPPATKEGTRLIWRESAWSHDQAAPLHILYRRASPIRTKKCGQKQKLAASANQFLADVSF